jgi:ABC-type amino acid transport substrate-binding protein
MTTSRRVSLRHVALLALVLCVIGGIGAGAALADSREPFRDAVGDGRVLGEAAADSGQTTPLRVVTKKIEPFVFMDDDRLTGFSIDLWEETALLAQIPFEWVIVDTVGEQLDAVTSGDAAVGIAAISMTSEREEIVDFSHPYFRSGLRIMTKSREVGMLERLVTVLLSPRLLASYSIVFIALLVIGCMVWFFERKRNDQYPREFWPGVWEGIWWAAATVTTVGYGDRTVTGTLGRILGLFWMFAGIFFVANFTAVITSELTVARLKTGVNGVEDLPGALVATVAGTTSSDYLDAEEIEYTGVKLIDDAVALLSDGLVDAVVFDGPVLQYELAKLDDPTLQLVGGPFHREDYALALPLDSPYRQRINIALLELWENGTHAELLDKWSISDR